MPYLALPFNIVVVCSFLTIKPTTTDYLALNSTTTAIPETTTEEESFSDEIVWSKVWEGVLVSLSQVYGLNDVPLAIMVALATLIASPLLCASSFFGAFIGTFLGTYVYFK